MGGASFPGLEGTEGREGAAPGSGGAVEGNGGAFVGNGGTLEGSCGIPNRPDEFKEFDGVSRVTLPPNPGILGALAGTIWALLSTTS